jgi:hypothetical protein
MSGWASSVSSMDPVVAPTPSSGRWRPAAALTLVVLVAGIGLVAAVLVARSSAGSSPRSVASPPSPGNQSVLHSVACTSAASCVAAGSFSVRISPNSQHSLVERWNGTSWSVVRAPSPGTDTALQSVACASPTSCVAVGSSGTVNTPNAQHALVESWDGSSWSVASIQVPGSPSSLQAVACALPNACMAVGWWSSTAGVESALVESWNGAAWTLVSTPSSPGSFATWFESVACGSPTSCVAVGNYYSSDGDDPGAATLVESWNGVTWSVTPSPSPGREMSVLNSIACTSPTACVAVGAIDRGDVYHADHQGLVESWDGTVWSVVPSPSLGVGVQSVLQAIACTSPTRCVAVGSTTPPNKGARILAESWDGTSWSVVSSPSINGAFESVACTSPISCLAAGEHRPVANPSGQTLATWWRGAATWNP